MEERDEDEIGEKEKEKPLFMAILPTQRCDTGCSHCISESTPIGFDLSLDSVKDLRKSIDSYPGRVRIAFTGGGEPLMWPQLPEAIDLLRGAPRSCMSSRKIAIVTSGCLNAEDKRFPVLKAAIEAHDFLTIVQSFNLFARSFPQRVNFTLPFLLKNFANPYIFFKISAHHGMVKTSAGTFSSPGIEQTFGEFEKILRKTIGPFRSMAVPSFTYRQTSFIARVIDWRNPTVRDILFTTGFMGESLYAPLKYPKAIIASFSPVQLNGRAKSLRRLGRGYSPILSCEERCRPRIVTLDHTGNFVFCPRRGFPPLVIGRPGGSLREVLKRKRRIFRELALDSLRFSDFDYFTICEACQRKAWQLYG